MEYKMKVSELLRKTGITILTLTLLNAGVVYYFIHKSEDSARLVNRAGLVRGLSQRVLKLDYAGRYDEASRLVPTVEDAISDLKNGNSDSQIDRIGDQEFQTLIDGVSSDWDKLQEKILETKREPKAFEELLTMSEDYFILTDRAVAAAEAVGKRRVVTSEAVLIVMLLLQLGVLFILRGITKRRVLMPLGMIMEVLPRAAGGDLAQRLPMKGEDEFGEIADVFNKLISGLQEMIYSLDEKVKQKTRELEIKVKEEITSKNRIEEEKKEIEKLLIENEKFKLAIQGASDHIIITDVEGIILFCNPAAERTTGYSLKEMVGKKAGVLWGHMMERDYYAKLWKTIKEDKKPFRGIFHNHRKGGELYDAEVKISPIFDKNGTPVYFVGIERDITEELAVDKAKTEFVSVASHQLRTPLTAVNWYTEILLSQKAGKINKKQKEYLNEIDDGNRRMIKLVNNLLSVSRLELGTFPVYPEKADLCVILNDVVKEVGAMAVKKKIDIEVVCPAKKIEMMVDISLSRFIFQNLLTNAVKYTGDKGKIRVEMKKAEKDVEFSVSDNGIGIPESSQKNIFTKFYRASNVDNKDTDGTGLGLYIVKSVVDFIGGKIRFTSKEGEGTTFYLTIPSEGMKLKNSKKNN